VVVNLKSSYNLRQVELHMIDNSSFALTTAASSTASWITVFVFNFLDKLVSSLEHAFCLFKFGLYYFLIKGHYFIVTLLLVLFFVIELMLYSWHHRSSCMHLATDLCNVLLLIGRYYFLQTRSHRERIQMSILLMILRVNPIVILFAVKFWRETHQYWGMVFRWDHCIYLNCRWSFSSWLVCLILMVIIAWWGCCRR
jgi:hypothetical protein